MLKKGYITEEKYKKNIDKKQKAASLMPREALNTLTDAIRARKARAEANKLRSEKVQNDVSSILNDIIDAVPIKSKNKKNSEAVAKHKERKASGEARTYKTRSKGRTLNL